MLSPLADGQFLKYVSYSVSISDLPIIISNIFFGIGLFSSRISRSNGDTHETR